MATLLQIRTKVRSDIAQSEGGDFSDTELNGFINEGSRYVGALVKKPTDHVEIQVEEGYEGYTLPSDAILLLDAYFGNVSVQGDVLPLEIVTEESLKAVNPIWMDSTSATKGRPNRIMLLNARTVLLNPRPDAEHSASGKKLILNYCYQPASLSTDADTPAVPIVYHDLISKYAQHLCYMSAKMSKPEEGLAIFNSLAGMARQLENLITKEKLNMGFYWGMTLGDDDSNIASGRL